MIFDDTLALGAVVWRDPETDSGPAGPIGAELATGHGSCSAGRR
jgi:hypothetical protein